MNPTQYAIHILKELAKQVPLDPQGEIRRSPKLILIRASEYLKTTMPPPAADPKPQLIKGARTVFGKPSNSLDIKISSIYNSNMLHRSMLRRKIK